MRYTRFVADRSRRERWAWIVAAVLAISWSVISLVAYWGDDTPVLVLRLVLAVVWLWIGYVEARALLRGRRARR